MVTLLREPLGLPEFPAENCPAVFHERILPHLPSKLNEKAQSLGIKLINVIDLSFFFAFVSM